MGSTTLSFGLSPGAASQLKVALARVLDAFREKEAMERPRRLDDIKFRVAAGEGTPGGEEPGVELEVYCNPNAHASAFQATVLLRMTAGGDVALTSEVPLSSVKADVEAWFKQQART